jgi:hypothetical protein
MVQLPDYQNVLRLDVSMKHAMPMVALWSDTVLKESQRLS